jgi:hypothetical protein
MVLQHIQLAGSKAIVLFIVAISLFILGEPMVTRSAAFDAEQFIITQEILGEISLTLSTTTVEMTGPIGGVLGGTATGTIDAVVRSNSGYTMTIEFDNDPAMLGDNTGSDSIKDYIPVGAEPDFSLQASTSATFAYTVAANPAADMDASFKDNGTSACGGANTGTLVNTCWQGPSTSPYQVIDRSTGTGLGSATTTFTFVLNVPNNPLPAVPADFYTATATLTATVQ